MELMQACLPHGGRPVTYSIIKGTGQAVVDLDSEDLASNMVRAAAAGLLQCRGRIVYAQPQPPMGLDSQAVREN